MQNGLILLGIFLLTFNNPKLVRTKISNEITVFLPANFTPMSPNDIAQQYPSVRSPIAIYTNADFTANFSINTSATQWPDGNIEMARKFFEAGITNLYDRVDFIDQGIHTVHKRKLIFFEFESRVNGEKLKQGALSPMLKYTYIQYLILKDKTLVFSFNCSKDEKNDWQQTVHALMKTVKVTQL